MRLYKRNRHKAKIFRASLLAQFEREIVHHNSSWGNILGREGKGKRRSHTEGKGKRVHGVFVGTDEALTDAGSIIYGWRMGMTMRKTTIMLHIELVINKRWDG